jgi:hypothetical protein
MRPFVCDKSSYVNIKAILMPTFQARAPHVRAERPRARSAAFARRRAFPFSPRDLPGAARRAPTRRAGNTRRFRRKHPSFLTGNIRSFSPKTSAGSRGEKKRKKRAGGGREGARAV